MENLSQDMGKNKISTMVFLLPPSPPPLLSLARTHFLLLSCPLSLSLSLALSLSRSRAISLYIQKRHYKFLYELVPDKNIGINALRSIYTSHFLPKSNKNQINRVAFLMRTSFNMLSTNYLKSNEEEEET
jgi:hypothetical protein